jgi:PiT family inorganic phosphate transporter
LPAIASVAGHLHGVLQGKQSTREIAPEDRSELRSDLYLASESIGKLIRLGAVPERQRAGLVKVRQEMEILTRYIPPWVKFAIALALGLGTMVGWQRIVVTVGEKIGKTHLSYAQGASAELVAAATIGLADIMGLPVSTTHVLSSGVAGTMAANHSGLQMQTLRNLLVAWVLTVPVCVFLGALLFALGLNLLAGLNLA